MYGEDVDLSYRIRQLGYKNWYLASSTIIHFKGESTKKDAKYVTMFYRAMALFVEKHYGKQWGGYSFLLQTAIRARAALSFAGKLFSPAPKTKPRPPASLIIAGTKAAADGAASILAQNNYPAPGAIITAVAGESLLHYLAPPQKNREIVFCVGTIPYREIIDTIGKLPNGIPFRFHAEDSRSIVGSQSKNAGGDAIGGEI